MTDNEILTLKEVCAITKLSKHTIYCLKYAGKIPHFKFGPRLLRFKRSEILHWMEHRDEYQAESRAAS